MQNSIMDRHLSLRLIQVAVFIYCYVRFTNAFGANYYKQEISINAVWREFIKNRTKHDVNIDKLMQQYALICPIRYNCMNATSLYVVEMDHLKNSNYDCPTCYCDPGCIDQGNCCPDTVYGYLSYDCINVNIYPKNVSRSKMMITKCLDNYLTDDKESYRKCSEEKGINPVTSLETGLTYKNKYCAVCNYDNNTISWKISVSCPYLSDTADISSSSIPEFMKALEQNKCNVYYQNLDNNQIHDDVSRACDDELNKSQKQSEIIGRCNVTGLWQDYNADTEWACSNLKLRYGHFKNVFCYICNPSLLSTFSGLVVDSCNVTGKWDEFNFDNNLVEACTLQQHSTRLNPFKNIYCMLCNGKYSYRMRYQYRDVETDISSNVNVKGNTISNYVDGTFIINGVDAVNAWKAFVNKFFMKQTLVWSNDYAHSKQPEPDEVNLLKQLKAFKIVCGDKQCIDNELAYTAKTQRPPTYTNTSEQMLTIQQSFSNPVCQAMLCSCDSSCTAKSNCCPEIVLSMQPYSCKTGNTFQSVQSTPTSIKKHNGHYMADSKLYKSSFMVIDKCMSLNSSSKLSRKCSNYSSIGAGILQNIPVQTDSIAYRNIYCLVCSGNNMSEVNRLEIEFQVKCEYYLETSLIWNIESFINISLKHCSISFVPTRSRKCENKDNASLITDNLFSISRDVITFNKDENTYSSIMVPKQETIVFSTCNVTGKWRYENKIISKMCEGYSANTMTLQEYRLNGKIYRNFACFLCNPEIDETKFDMNYMVSICNVTGLWKQNETDEMKLYERKCNTTNFQPRWLPFKNLYCSECNLPPITMTMASVDFVETSRSETIFDSKSNYRTLFSLSPSIAQQMEDFDDYIEVPTCVNGTYDEIQNKCRDLFCYEGKILFNGSCIYIVNEAQQMYKISIKLKPVFFTHGHSNYNPKYVSQGVHLFLPDVCSNLLSNIQGMLDNSSSVSKENCRIISESLCDTNYTHLVIYNETSSFSCEITVNMFSKNLTHDEQSLVKALSANYTLYNGRNETILFTALFVGNLTHSDEPNTTNNKCEYIDTNNEPITFLLAAGQKDIQELDNLLSCAQLELKATEYTFQSKNNSITVKVNNRHNISFNQEEFKLKGRKVRICRDLFINKINMYTTNKLPINTFAYVYNVFSSVCTFMSMLCLMLTFVTYCIFKSLRTTPGLNNMGLVFSLFFAQGFLKFGLGATFDDTICKAMGILIHYFWLSTFCAMNACCIHMFNVFYASNMHLPHNGTSSRRRIKYLSYIYGVPCVTVLLTVCVHLILTKGTFIGYGEVTCFLSDIYTVVISFIGPACLIFLANIILFSLAFHKIRTSPQVESSSDRNELFLCIKLCTLVGITWPLQIVDATLELSVFSYFVVGINASQGVFIFLSYVCNKRVMSMYRNKMCGTKEKRSTESSSYNTSSTKLTDLHTRISKPN